MSWLVRQFSLFLAAVSAVCAASPAVSLQFRIETNGPVIVTSSSSLQGLRLTPVMPEVLGCKSRLRATEYVFGRFECSDALRRDGLTLEAVFDPAPIARMLPPTSEMELTVDYPRLGFDEASSGLRDESQGRYTVRSLRIPAGQALTPVRIRFGYRPAQAVSIFTALLGIALAIVLVTAMLCKRGLAHLQRSVFILGNTLWFAIVWQLHATEPLRILLAGTPLAQVASTLLVFLPPLLCVASGAAWGRSKKSGPRSGYFFREVFWSYGLFLFPLAGALASVPYLERDPFAAIAWLIASAASAIWCYRRVRAMAGAMVRQLTTGALRERLAELAVRAGHKDARFFVSFSARSKNWNAFAQLGNSIILGGPLVESLTKREVDAIASHELSHLGRLHPGIFSTLAIAAVLFQTPLIDVLASFSGGSPVPLDLTGGLFVVAIFLNALRAARRREFAADAGAVALTGDPRAMIAGLARIARHNHQPLRFNAVVEWLSTHPSTEKRIRTLAMAARLDATEVEALCAAEFPGERYALPVAEEGAIFNVAWQAANAARYAWSLVLAAPTVGLLIAVLVERIPDAGIVEWIAGIIVGCCVTKLICSAVTARNYARLGRMLERKLGVGGELVGFAPGSEMRVFHGFRFADAGLLWFEKGRLHYRSERTLLDLGPADILDVGMVAAAPVSWRRLRPMVRLRRPQSEGINTFILHPLAWGASATGLLHQIEKWRAASQDATQENAVIRGLDEVPGEPYRPPRIEALVRGFRVSGPITILGAMLAGWPMREGGLSGWYALAVAASAYLFMVLPALRRSG